MTIDDLIAALDEAADQALPAAARRLFGPSRVPPPSPAEVEAFEAEIGTTLPADYRQFLLRSNGGRLDWFRFDGPTPQGKAWPVEPEPVQPPPVAPQQEPPVVVRQGRPDLS